MPVVKSFGPIYDHALNLKSDLESPGQVGTVKGGLLQRGTSGDSGSTQGSVDFSFQ